jgi:uncharacterized protein YndB with AHSA1/START domain
MKKYTVKKDAVINTSKQNVWKVLITPELFAKWGSAFCPGSKMEGEWKLDGSVSYYDDAGMGLKCKVIAYDPHNLVTVEYVGFFHDFKEELRTEEKEGWIGCKETYVLSEINGKTQLHLESEVPTEAYFEEFSKTWDLALQNIKELAEKDASTNHPNGQ